MKIDWDKEDTKKVLIYIAAGAGILLIYFSLANLSAASKFLKTASDILRPFTIAFVFAYILNSPMMFFERHLFCFVSRKKPHRSLRRTLSIILTWIVSIAVLALFFYIIIPEIGDSINTLVKNFGGYFQSFKNLITDLCTKYGVDQTYFEPVLEFQITGDKLLEVLKQYGENLIPQIKNIANISIQIGSAVADALIAIVVSIYLMFSKETLIAQAKKGLYAIMKSEKVETLVHIARESHRIFIGFINGKLLDSLIIGILCFIGMSILGFEYPLLISFIVGVTNVIPFFGPIFGAVPSVLILLIVNPIHAVWLAVFILALQQLDGNVIGPKILGDSTGLPAIWVIFAILIGGGLFGVAGMFIGVPAFAVIYKFSSEYFQRRLIKKGMPADTESYKVVRGVKEKDDIESAKEKQQ